MNAGKSREKAKACQGRVAHCLTLTGVITVFSKPHNVFQGGRIAQGDPSPLGVIKDNQEDKTDLRSFRPLLLLSVQIGRVKGCPISFPEGS